MEYEPLLLGTTPGFILRKELKLYMKNATKQLKKKVCVMNLELCVFCLPAGLGGELCAGPECRPALRGLALSRAEDLRAELLRAEHLKAEALWEESSDGSRQARTTIVNRAR